MNKHKKVLHDTYDIFLSYRRKGGYEVAKHLFDRLSQDHYRVSFDIDTLRSGNFATQLHERVKQCTDFILILDRNAFGRKSYARNGRCEDWMRIELAQALQQGKNVIPVFLDGFREFPDLPSDIDAVRKANGIPYNLEYYDAFYEKFCSFLHSDPCTSPILPEAILSKIKSRIRPLSEPLVEEGHVEEAKCANPLVETPGPEGSTRPLDEKLKSTWQEAQQTMVDTVDRSLEVMGDIHKRSMKLFLRKRGKH